MHYASQRTPCESVQVLYARRRMPYEGPQVHYANRRIWNLSSKSLKALEISYNKILRRIWKLPYSSHTRIVHCTAKLLSLFNSTLKRIFVLFSTSQKCSSNLVRYVFNKSASCCFGYNLKYCHQFCKSYSGRQFCADVIRDIRSAQSFLSLSNTLLDSVVCSLSTYSF